MGRGLGGGWKAGHRPGSREERAGGLGSPGNLDSWYGWRSEECLATDMIVKVFFFFNQSEEIGLHEVARLSRLCQGKGYMKTCYRLVVVWKFSLPHLRELQKKRPLAMEWAIR